MKLFFLFILIFLISILFSDFEIIDEDIILDPETHFYELQEDLDETEKDKISFSFQTYGRYQEKTDNLKNKNRIQVKNNIFNLKLIHEYNTNLENSDMPLGVSLSIKTTKSDQLIIGQYQIQQGYGLLQSRNSFISEKPNFNTNFSSNKPSIYSNARPYFSHSLLGVAYKKTLGDFFTLYIYGSHQDVGAKIADGKVTTLDLTEPNPNNSIIQSMGGSIIHYNNKNLNISSMVNYFKTDIPYQKEPVSGSLAFSYTYDTYLFFGESAFSEETFAHLYGIKNSFQRFSQTISYRRIENEYHSDYANFPSNSSNQTNEEGLFYKVEYRNSGFSMLTFADIFNNLENNERYDNKNIGNNVGLRLEQRIENMIFGLSIRQKNDKEWRNLNDFSRYENRKREYLKLSWTQTNTHIFSTKMTFDFQQREYIDYKLKNDGYALSQSFNMSFNSSKFTFTAGVFDTEIPLHLYLYNGRLNNPLIVLSGEGQYAMLHLNNNIYKKWQMEMMGYYLNKDLPEYTVSAIIMYRI